MGDLKERMKALEAEMADLRIQMWAHETGSQDPHDPQSDNKNSNPDSLMSFTIVKTPVPTRRNSTSTWTLEGQEVEDQVGPLSVSDSIDTLGRTAQPIDDGNFFPAGGCSSDTPREIILSDHAQRQVVGPETNLTSDNSDSPLNTSNPHPELSISIAFLHKAIIGCRKLGSKFVRSILHREPPQGQVTEWPDCLFAADYTEWRWTPFLISGDAAELVSTNILKGDIELICMKNQDFAEMISSKVPMFEEPSRLLDTSVLLTELQPDFSSPEAWGYRVLAWKVHGLENAFYMDRQGHPIPGPLCLLPWQMTECED
ncbi:hypothetical protein NW762_012421 [Fusarium torreyae]|uniref:Uncharacterized protein n=1 Tax=Fusarium torreyae TaxID=1237075 RepID=A0A9W8VBE7_9HYPO|nr:hypothetical protein NW762_012421 [Fusarium torreyae]